LKIDAQGEREAGHRHERHNILQQDTHFESDQLVVTSLADLPTYIHAYLIPIWQAVEFIFSVRPLIRSEYDNTRLSDEKASLCRFRASIPEKVHPWFKHLIVHMVLLKRAGVDPLMMLEGMPGVEDVANLAERVSEYWATVALKGRNEKEDETRPHGSE
jgi:hypothetical protein